MKQPAPVDNWLDQARQLLDHDVDTQDYAVRTRLTAARQRILQQRMPRTSRLRGVFSYAAVAASICAVLVVAQLSWLAPATSPRTTKAIEQATLLESDEDLLATADNLELYENLEFYAWLQSQPVDG
jgi:hypothetical protein